MGNDINSEAIHDRSGNSVSLRAGGSVVAVGAIHNAGNGTYLIIVTTDDAIGVERVVLE